MMSTFLCSQGSCPYEALVAYQSAWTTLQLIVKWEHLATTPSRCGRATDTSTVRNQEANNRSMPRAPSNPNASYGKPRPVLNDSGRRSNTAPFTSSGSNCANNTRAQPSSYYPRHLQLREPRARKESSRKAECGADRQALTPGCGQICDFRRD